MHSLRRVGQAALALVVILMTIGIVSPAPIATAQQSCTGAIDIVLVLDGSGSINSSDFATMKTFSKSIVSSFTLSEQQTHIGIVQFSSAAQVEIGLSGDANAVNNAIDSMVQLDSNTDIAAGLNLGQQLLDNSGRSSPRILVLLTDGISEASSAIAAAQSAKRKGTQIIAVGIGNGVDFDLLNKIASDPDSEYVYSAGDFADLLNILPQITQEICTGQKAGRRAEVKGQPAYIIVYQNPNPNTAARRDGIVTFSIVAKNLGKGSAKDAVVTMPFDPTEVRVIDAKFSRKGPWVSKLITNTLEFRTGSLASKGDTITATVRLATLPTVADSTSLAERLTYRWDDDRSGGEGHSNLPILTVGGSDNNQQFYSLNVEPASGPAGSTHSFKASIFAPDEPITFWYNAPDGAVKPLSGLMADTNGAINATFKTTNLPAGTYSMVARGNWTGFTVVGTFHVQ